MRDAELAEVLSQVQAGDPDAWGELYRRYAPAIFRFCRQALRVREDAEDATMEIFIKVLQRLDSFDRSRPFKAWLYAVASNHCWDILRRRSTRQNLETEDAEALPIAAPDPDQLERLQAERQNAEVRAALEKLPDRARMALLLRYFAEMSYEEVAATLKVRRESVGVLLLRARHQLRAALEIRLSREKP
jgi:RNA polymerase sigma factor (sigma-70 family)